MLAPGKRDSDSRRAVLDSNRGPLAHLLDEVAKQLAGPESGFNAAPAPTPIDPRALVGQ